MFKIGSCEEELFSNMEKNLIANDIEKEYKFSKLAQAADLLNDAANIFELANMVDEASAITEVLVSLGNKISKIKVVKASTKMSTLELMKNYPEAWKALPESYANDSVLEFYFQDGNLIGCVKESEIPIVGDWEVMFDLENNKWIQIN